MGRSKEQIIAEVEALRNELAELEENFNRYGFHHGPTGYGVAPVAPLTYGEKRQALKNALAKREAMLQDFKS